MKFFDVIQVLDRSVDPRLCKLHLATGHPPWHPLQAYFEGRFDQWQAEQTQRNFQRPLVISLITLPEPDSWLFAGVHDSHGCRHQSDAAASYSATSEMRYYYDLVRRASVEELDGRLVVRFRRPGRQSYLNAERWADRMEVAQLLPKRLSVAEFPGYTATILSKAELDVIVRRGVASWKAALENVAGVYVISDRKSGKLYVGSATGEGGIWSRWSSYSATGHGGNKELRELLNREGARYAENFTFGVLEIADTNASAANILERESRWKELLLAREHGLNAN